MIITDGILLKRISEVMLKFIFNTKLLNDLAQNKNENCYNSLHLKVLSSFTDELLI